jgi:hypothetical protein
MRRFRFHIGSLLIFILFSGVGFAALREAENLWDNGTFSLTITVLLVSVLLVLHRGGLKRAFWVGFALFGWIYFGLTWVASIESRLLTTQALAYLDSRLANRPLMITGADWGSSGNAANGTLKVAFSPDGNLVADYGSQGAVRLWDVATGAPIVGGWKGTTQNFVRIGHSLLTLIVAYLGGWLSCHLSRSRMTVATPASPPVLPRNDAGA